MGKLTRLNKEIINYKVHQKLFIIYISIYIYIYLYIYFVEILHFLYYMLAFGDEKISSSPKIHFVIVYS